MLPDDEELLVLPDDGEPLDAAAGVDAGASFLEEDDSDDDDDDDSEEGDDDPARESVR